MSIIVVNFGSQFTQLIVRRIRDLGVNAIVTSHEKFSKISPVDYKGIVVSGSDQSVDYSNAGLVKFMDSVLKVNTDYGIPVLGICYGFHLLSAYGDVNNIKGNFNSEFGKTHVTLMEESRLFSGFNLGEDLVVWMSHGDSVVGVTNGFTVVAKSENENIVVVAHEGKKIYGVQFHLEVSHTTCGAKLISNFLDITGCERNSNLVECFRCNIEIDIAKQVQDKNVIAAVSGGVDSTVASVLLHNVIGDKLYCVMVDHGLMRKGEVEEVKEMFATLGIKLNVYNAENIFLTALSGVSDPEQKRKTIGEKFIECFKDATGHIEDLQFFMQGTLYPDIIESGFDSGDVIKSHHNVGGLPDQMNWQLVEPLKCLFKDEVREIGKKLGLPQNFVGRHPFPGPGLAIRIPGEVTKEKIKVLQEVDHIYIETMKSSGLYDVIWQAFPVLLPVKSVGVMGDKRTYEYCCVLRAVVSIDGMTADAFPFSNEDYYVQFWAFLREVSIKIINDVKGVNRVLYDITSKPPGTVEWE